MTSNPSPKPPFLLLFDIDGTILTSGGAGMIAMATVATRLFGEKFSWEGVESAGHLDPLIFSEAAQNNRIPDPDLHHQKFHDAYIAELQIEIQRRRPEVIPTPGIHSCLQRLHQRARVRGDIELGLLTGNYTAAVPVKLHAVGVDLSWFSITAFGDEARTRPDLVALAMRKYHGKLGLHADPRRVVVIGDTPRDVACAHAHGCVALAVATGIYTLEQLQATRAEIVVSDLKDPAPLMGLIGE